MRKQIMGFAVSIAVGSIVTAIASAAAPSAAQIQAAAQLASHDWSCETTEANGTMYREKDTIEPVGRWLHGTAYRLDGKPGPRYDYYLGYVDSHWIFIQIDPGRGGFFVGTTIAGLNGLNGSRWSIDYPSKQSGYKFTEMEGTFTIARSDMTQVCKRTTSSPVVPSAYTLTCRTWRTGSNVLGQQMPATETLTISKPGERWWQGVATDANSGERVYQYNVFNIPLHRISVLINASTGSYAIATSYQAQSLEGTTWIVVYPTEEHGFTFKDVAYVKGVPGENDLPNAFTIVFADGYQTCGER